MNYTSTVVVGGKKYASQREASLARAEVVAKPKNRQAEKILKDVINKKCPLEYKLYKKYIHLKKACMQLVGIVHVPIDPCFTSFDGFKKAIGLPPGINHMLYRIDNKIGYVASNLKWVEKKQGDLK